MNKTLFGTLENGEKIYAYTIKSKNTEAEIITFGAAISRFVAFGKNIVCGYDNIEDYIVSTSHHGSTVGRIANRVKDAKFTIDGVTYHLPKNDNGNCLHGGSGFDRRVWTVDEHKENSITLSYVSPHLEEGFPGELKTVVSFTLEDNALTIDYVATPKAKTPISLTNHSYFNIDGIGNDIKKQKITLFADRYTEVDSLLIPTGNRPSVKGTVFDLNTPTVIESRISEDFKNFDHNFHISSDKTEIFAGKELKLFSILEGKELNMYSYTDQPCVQLYFPPVRTPNPDFRDNAKNQAYCALCLETQTEPNSVNLGEGIYGAGETYTHTTVYRIERRAL